MKYRHLVEKPNYADFASGKVLLGLPGHVATPLRLADAFDTSPLDPTIVPDDVMLVLSDLPYGRNSQWLTPWLNMAVPISDSQLATRWLGSLARWLRPGAVVGLLAEKTVKISHSHFRVLRHVRAGQRSGMILPRSH